LGGSSAVFLLGYIFWSKLSQKVQAASIFYQSLFLVLLLCVYHIFVNRLIIFPILLRDAVIGLLFLFILKRIIPPVKKENRLEI
jgi:hypothetical protein